MVQRALIRFDKTVFLRKNCYRNGLIMCIVVHETRRLNKNYGLLINDRLTSFLCILLTRTNFQVLIGKICHDDCITSKLSIIEVMVDMSKF